jgi:Do/DeqQ family serine protease
MNTQMKRVWKIAWGVTAVAVVSVGAAVGLSTYLVNKKTAALDSQMATYMTEYGFRQQVRNVSYGTVTPESSVDFTTAAAIAVPAVVHIKSVVMQDNNTPQGYIDPFEYFFGFGGRSYSYPRQRQPQVGFGSGVIISTDGYIMTNNHVINGADQIEVTLNDGSRYKAKIIGQDPVTDIALLKINAKNLPTIPFGDSDKLKVGEWVLAVGNPFNLTSTVTAGIVSAKGRGSDIGMGGSGDGSNVSNKIQSYIQTDAAVNPGNSGGALVNTKGELVGINTMIMSETGNYAGYSFAVPISIAAKVVADLKQYGTVQRAMLGVTMQDVTNLSDAQQSKLKVKEGAYIVDFADFSAAKSAGIEKGDVITAVNGTPIKNGSELQENISRHRPGDKVKVTVNRDGSVKTFTVELKNANGNTALIKGQNGSVSQILGASFMALTNEEKRSLGISYGVEVAAVYNGRVRDAGIPKGFIIMIANNQHVNKPEDLIDMASHILKSDSDDKVIYIKGIYKDGSIGYKAINLSSDKNSSNN